MIKIISCEIFKPYIEHLLKTKTIKTDFEIEYYDIDQHNYPIRFNQVLQEKIDEVKDFEMIILLYGICGNVTSNIVARHCPVVMPKVHDCASVLLGSKKRFLEVFAHRLSTPWQCYAHVQSNSHHQYIDADEYNALVEKYGEDNAAYLREILFHPEEKSMVYLSMDLAEDLKQIKKLSNEIEVVNGSPRYLLKLLNLDFSEALVLKPGEKMVPTYDQIEVMKKSKH